MNTAHVTRIILTAVRPTCCHIYYFIYQYINNLLITYFFHFRMVTYHTIAKWSISHLNSAHSFICILYFGVYFKPYILKLGILNLHWSKSFCNISFVDTFLRMVTSLAETCTCRSLNAFII